MAQILCKITLDMQKGYSDEVIVAKEGDSASRFVRAELLHAGKRLVIGEDDAVVLNVKRADGERASFAGFVEGDGQLLLPIGGWMLEMAGTSECDITVTDQKGGRLTTPTFCVVTEEAIIGDGELTENGESITAEFLQARQIFSLLPEWQDSRAVFYPLANRSYQMDLSGEEFQHENAWQQIGIVMPEVEDIHKAQKILLQVHAPQNKSGEYPTLSFDGSVIFEHGKAPVLGQPDTCILCVFAPRAGKWLASYGVYGENVSDPLDAATAKLSTEIAALREVVSERAGISYHICTKDELTDGAPNFVGESGVIYLVPTYDMSEPPDAANVLEGSVEISRGELFSEWIWAPVTQEYSGYDEESGSEFTYDIEGHFERLGPDVSKESVLQAIDDAGGSRSFKYEEQREETDYYNYYLMPNQTVDFSHIQDEKHLYLVESSNGRDNEWCFVIRHEDTAYPVSLPEGIEWIGDAPTFEANSTTKVCLFYKGDTLMGVAV